MDEPFYICYNCPVTIIGDKINMSKIKCYVTKQDNKVFSAKLAYTQNSKPLVEKTNFKSYQEAQDWLRIELYKILPNPMTVSFKKLTNVLLKNPKDGKFNQSFDEKIKNLYAFIISNAIEFEHLSENEAQKKASQILGKTEEMWFKKSQDGQLDKAWNHEWNKYQKYLFLMEQYPAEKESQDLLNIIIKMPGSKILTVTNDNNEPYSFHIFENGHVADNLNDIDLKNIVLSQFDYMLNGNGGSIIIRQFIPQSEEPEWIDGQKILIPWKALYAIVITEGLVIPLSAEDVEYSMNTDPVTKKEIDPEPKVIYKDFNEFFQSDIPVQSVFSRIPKNKS